MVTPNPKERLKALLLAAYQLRHTPEWWKDLDILPAPDWQQFSPLNRARCLVGALRWSKDLVPTEDAERLGLVEGTTYQRVAYRLAKTLPPIHRPATFTVSLTDHRYKAGRQAEMAEAQAYLARVDRRRPHPTLRYRIPLDLAKRCQVVAERLGCGILDVVNKCITRYLDCGDVTPTERMRLVRQMADKCSVRSSTLATWAVEKYLPDFEAIDTAGILTSP